MSTDSHGTGDQPTTPIPRPGRSDDPTQVFGTFDGDAAPTRPAPTVGAGGGPGTTATDAGATDAGAVRTEAPHDRAADAGAATTTGGRPVSRTLRVGTVVWGLIIAIIGAGLVSVAGGARFDVELVLIGLLALAGVALVAGSLAVSMRRRR